MLNEFKKWSYHEKLIQGSEHLSDADKERALAGLDQIKEILGERFLENAVETEHPILQYFVNSAPWTRSWLADFGNMLDKLREAIRFERLRQRLVSGKEFLSAMPELEVAYRFRKAGFSVEFYVKHDGRDCDLRVWKGDIELYVEVAIVGWSMEELKAFHILDVFSLPEMTDFEIRVAGKIHKILSSPRIIELKKQLDICIQEAKQKQECTFLSQPGIVDLIICPRSKSDQVSKWLRKKGLKSDLEGPPYDINEVKRVIRMFREKSPQLPKNKPSLIVLFPARLFIKEDLNSFRELTYKIEEEIYEHSNLVAGALVFSGFRGSTETGRYEKHLFWSKKTKHQFYGESTLVIRNKYSDFPISEEIISALIG